MRPFLKEIIFGKRCRLSIAFVVLILCIGFGSSQALAAAPYVPIYTSGNNITILDSSGATVGGANDIKFTWDGTLKTSVAVSGQVSNATISSSCLFFGQPWWAHDVAIYGPGTYTVYTDCPAGSPGCGSGVSYTFTVNPGEIGGHMFWNWKGINENVDVVNVWRPGSFDLGVDSNFCVPAEFWAGACGAGDAAQIWDWMSYDWDGDCVNGSGMVDGPFAGMNVNFNLMGSVPSPLCEGVICNDNNACTIDACDPATGSCVFTPRVCSDLNVCTDDSCDPVVGCVFTSNTVMCNDYNECTTGDVCSNGICKGSPIVCNDNNACTNDACVAGNCVFTARDCNDYNMCTTDTCDTSTGCIHTLVICDDQNLCTLDTCDRSSGCVFTPGCDDSNVCTMDTCDPATGICEHAAMANCIPITTTNNNLTVNQSDGTVLGGTNDVTFNWDGTLKTSVVMSGQVANGMLSSPCSFFGSTWKAHDVAIYGPGTYTVYAGCPPGSPGCGTDTPITFTVKPGEIGGHILINWNNSDNMDVVNVWKRGSYDQGVDPYFCGPSEFWVGACGVGDSAQIWDWMSTDWDGDCVNGGGMVDGPFAYTNVNFNLMGVPAPAPGCTSSSDCNDDNACTADSCDSATGCVHSAINCDDGNVCTADSCDPATGCIHTAMSCDDSNACTTDACDSETGACVFTPKCTPAVACDPATGQCIPNCEAGKSIIIDGGGQEPSTVDKQIRTSFTVMNCGHIIAYEKSSVTCAPGTVLLANFSAGAGPRPSSGTWRGASIPTGSPYTIECNAASGDAGKLVLDNKSAGGKDIDRITVKVQ